MKSQVYIDPRPEEFFTKYHQRTRTRRPDWVYRLARVILTIPLLVVYRFRAIGVDMTSDMLERARARVPGERLLGVGGELGAEHDLGRGGHERSDAIPFPWGKLRRITASGLAVLLLVAAPGVERPTRRWP